MGHPTASLIGQGAPEQILASGPLLALTSLLPANMIKHVNVGICNVLTKLMTVLKRRRGRHF